MRTTRNGKKKVVFIPIEHDKKPYQLDSLSLYPIYPATRTIPSLDATPLPKTERLVKDARMMENVV